VSRVVLSAEPLREGETALRPWRDTDLQSLVAACQDDEISRWTAVPFPYTEASGRAFLLHRHDAIHAGTLAPFAIVSADDSRLLGSVSLKDLDWTFRRAEVGYWLAREARGSGHAARAVRLICRWGFERLGLERIQLMAATSNAPSQRVAERAGFTREALLRSYLASPEGRRDMVLFALLAGD
jgi:RimJ/RimL family protein N-acetyltransferase